MLWLYLSDYFHKNVCICFTFLHRLQIWEVLSDRDEILTQCTSFRNPTAGLHFLSMFILDQMWNKVMTAASSNATTFEVSSQLCKKISKYCIWPVVCSHLTNAFSSFHLSDKVPHEVAYVEKKCCNSLIYLNC